MGANVLDALPTDVLVLVLGRIAFAPAERGAPPRRRLRHVLAFFMTCQRLWRFREHGGDAFFRAVCRTLDGYNRLAQGVPAWKIVSLQAAQACATCRVVTPAAIRWGFLERCCVWCFENATVPVAAARAALGGAHADALDRCRTDCRMVSVLSERGYRRKRRERVYLLRDVVQAAR